MPDSQIPPASGKGSQKIANWLPVGVFVMLALWIGMSQLFRVAHPPVGTYIGVLAFVAGIATIWPPDNPWAKAGWFLVFGGFLVLEITTLYQQRNSDLKKDRDETKNEDDRFADVLRQNQLEFNATVRRLNTLAGASADIRKAAHQSLNRFDHIFREEQQLFDHEEELAESLRGKLVPGNDPTPANSCGPTKVGDVILMLGSEEQHNAALVSRLPHVVLESRSHGPMVTLDRNGALLAIILDIRSDDGKIIARLNSNGWVVNRNNMLSASKDAHSLEILDEYGSEVLVVRYLNPRAVSIKGRGIGLPRGLTYVCSSGAGRADYSLP